MPRSFVFISPVSVENVSFSFSRKTTHTIPRDSSVFRQQSISLRLDPLSSANENETSVHRLIRKKTLTYTRHLTYSCACTCERAPVYFVHAPCWRHERAFSLEYETSSSLHTSRKTAASYFTIVPVDRDKEMRTKSMTILTHRYEAAALYERNEKRAPSYIARWPFFSSRVKWRFLWETFLWDFFKKTRAHTRAIRNVQNICAEVAKPLGKGNMYCRMFHHMRRARSLVVSLFAELFTRARVFETCMRIKRTGKCNVRRKL